MSLKSLNFMETHFSLKGIFYFPNLPISRISFFLMTTRRFMNPHLMTSIRSACVRNDNLTLVFEQLNIQTLLAEVPPTPKAKADVIEAIIGELGEFEAQDDSTTTPLNEILAFIAYLGEKTHMSNSVGLDPQHPKKPNPSEGQKTREKQSNDRSPQKSKVNPRQRVEERQNLSQPPTTQPTPTTLAHPVALEKPPTQVLKKTPDAVPPTPPSPVSVTVISSHSLSSPPLFYRPQQNHQVLLSVPK